MSHYWICFIGMVIGFFAGIFVIGIMNISSECSRQEERRRADKDIAKYLMEGK